MRKSELLLKIESLLPVLRNHQKTGEAKITQDEKQLLKEVIIQILGRITVDLTCPTCILNYLNIALSFYERENKVVVVDNKLTEEKVNGSIVGKRRKGKGTNS